MSWPRPIQLIGVGSPLGDDALGWEAVRQARLQLPGYVEVHLLEGGQRLLDVMDGRGSVLLVDALEPAGMPGRIRRIAWPSPDVETLRPGSTHHLRPDQALQLAETLGLLPYVVILAMEAGHLGPLEGLSPAVAAAMPELIRRIVEELVFNEG